MTEERPERVEAAVTPEEGTKAPEADPVQLLEQKQQELDQLHDRYLRLLADFENYRRRTRQEAEELRRTACERLLRELLPLLDNFERALASFKDSVPEKVAAGVEMIFRQLLNILNQEGVEPLESVGQPFDPCFHEAFAQLPTADYPEGTVAGEVQRGYLLRGKVLRPALVQVAVKPEETPKEDQESIQEEDGNHE